MSKSSGAYERLWKLAQDGDPVRVIYGTALAVGGSPLAEGGMFYPQDDQGRIDVWRMGYVNQFEPHWQRTDGVALTADELRAELYVLAHEYGHYRSWKAGTWAPHHAALTRFSSAVRESRPALRPDRDDVVGEEQGAWCTARVVLESLGWKDWLSFEATAHRAVASYANYPVEESP